MGPQGVASRPGPFAMAEPGLFLWRFEGWTSGGHRFQRNAAAMKTGVSCVALGLGLFTATMIAVAQTPSPTVLARAHLRHPRPALWRHHPPRRFRSRHQAFWRRRAAPLSVPPSGVLATVERHRVSNERPFKTTQNAHHPRSKPATIRRHVVHHSIAPRRDKSTPRTILAQNIPPPRPADSPPPEEGAPSSRSSERQKSLRNDENAKEGALAGIRFDRNCGQNRRVRRALVRPCRHRPQCGRDQRFRAQDDVLPNLSADLLKQRLRLDLDRARVRHSMNLLMQPSFARQQML